MISVAPIKTDSSPVPDPGPKSTLAENVENNVPEDSRKQGQRLSVVETNPQNEILKPSKSISVFDNLANFIKLNTSRAMWGIGFVTAGFAIVSNFLIGSQILSLIFAVPSLMAFFIGHSLGKGVVKGKNNLFQDSFKLIQGYLKDPRRLDDENIQALSAIDELINKMKKQPRTKDEITSLLKRLFDLTKLKLEQIKEGDDVNSARIRIETERIVNVLEPLFDGSGSESLLPESSS